MSEIIKYNNKSPLVDKSCFIASGVKLVGDIEIKQNSSVWFNSVLRADVSRIHIGEFSNIQDLTTIHVASEKTLDNTIIEELPCIIKDYVTIGHNCVIHACTINSNTLIGMGAVIMDGAIISENSILGANSLVTKNKTFPPNSLIQGSPAKVIRQLDEMEIKALKEHAISYHKLAKKYQTIK